jgi:hypothetical protein
MDVREVARAYAGLVAAGKMDEAAMIYWADDVVTVEAEPGEKQETHGKIEAFEKAKWWYDNHEVHGVRSEGPFVNGDSFLLILDVDVTPHGGVRTHMREIVGYKVRDGKVVEERYFY